MKNRIFKKENLDEFGANLLKAAQMTDTEIENIINKPQLFESVIARIKTKESDHRRKRFHTPGFRLNFVAFATAIVLMIATLAFYNHSDNFAEHQLAQSASNAETPIPIVSSEDVLMPSPETETKSIIKTTARATQIARQKIKSNRQHKSKKMQSTRKSSTVSDSIPVEQTFADEGKFYALPFADNSADTDITQIIRTELSRDELFALGIDISFTENDDERVLTELIYGANGNPKAFRIIGKL